MKVTDPTTFRDNMRHMFNKIVRNKLATKNLEKGIFNYAVKKARSQNIVRKWDNPSFVIMYVDKCKSLFLNLNGKSTVKNKQLLKRLKKGEFQPHELAFMSHQEMFPKKWKHLIDAKIKRDKNAGEVDLSAATDEFFCYKCKNPKPKCSYYQMQTRSADEPMTTFVTCLLCGNNWRC